MKNLNVLLALAGGAAIGAAIGILLAPDKGSETRHRIFHLMKSEKHLIKEQLQKFLQSKGINLTPDEMAEAFKDCPHMAEK